MWIKYQTITNNTLIDDSLPLDDEMQLRGWVSSNEVIGGNEHFIIPIENVWVFTTLYIL